MNMPNPVFYVPKREARIDFTAELWQPGFIGCGSVLLTDDDLICCHSFDRSAFDRWLTDSRDRWNDFRMILDFRVVVGQSVIDWRDDSSEDAFSEYLDGMM